MMKNTIATRNTRVRLYLMSMSAWFMKFHSMLLSRKRRQNELMCGLNRLSSLSVSVSLEKSKMRASLNNRGSRVRFLLNSFLRFTHCMRPTGMSSTFSIMSRCVFRRISSYSSSVSPPILIKLADTLDEDVCLVLSDDISKSILVCLSCG